MKKTFNDYRSSMDRITPSESFISDTEALMKKLRDEQAENKENKEKAADVQLETISLIDFDGRKARRNMIKRVAAGFSAAAAVIIAVVSFNVYDKVNISNVDTAVTENTADEESVDETAVSTVDDTLFTTVTADEPEKEDFSETVMEETEENADPKRTSETPAEDKKRDTAAYETDNGKTQNTDSGNGKGHDGVDSANIVTDTDNTVPYGGETEAEEFHTPDGNTYTGYGAGESEEKSKPQDSDITSEYTGVPVYVPGFEYGDYDGDYEDIFDDEDVSEPSYGYDDSSPAAYSLTFSYELDSEDVSDADKVYVPDNVFDLDSGEYYLVINAGFDSYDAVTGNISVPEEKQIDENDPDGISLIMNAVKSAAASGDASYFDTEQRLSDYRYTVAVYSADESEDNAILFDISFDTDTLVINRYDNGTVSSVEYSITSEDYERSEKALSELYD